MPGLGVACRGGGNLVSISLGHLPDRRPKPSAAIYSGDHFRLH